MPTVPPPAMTSPAAAEWASADPRFRRSEVTALVGTGDEFWQRATSDLLHWRIKTRSGFDVRPDEMVVVGARPIIVARVLGLTIREPVEVVAVVRDRDRVGFAYRTLPGHPVDGEEAFILHRRGDSVELTIRSLTRPPFALRWRLLYPALRIAQRVARRRYVRALR